jgi:hypothetical protein
MSIGKTAENAVKQPPARAILLEEALKITLNDRNNSYGAPEDNFSNIAVYWNSYLLQRFNGGPMHISSQDVAHLMILMKMARLASNMNHRDSLVDVAGYAACAEDCRDAMYVPHYVGGVQDAGSLFRTDASLQAMYEERNKQAVLAAIAEQNKPKPTY